MAEINRSLPVLRRAVRTAATVLTCVALDAGGALAADCSSLRNLDLPETTITAARLVPAGLFTDPVRSNLPAVALPAFCRVEGVIRPTPASNIEFEVWLPESQWNGRFLGVGNGGFAGSLTYSLGGVASALQRGFATATTDTGHKGVHDDARWALGQAEKVKDYGYRAIHETTIRAKAITKAFYDRPPEYAYFSSCSNGGRQALMEAQRFPEDYDGIVAGAPAYDFTHLMTEFAWIQQGLFRESSSWISPQKVRAVKHALIAECDRTDGVADDVIDDPRRCSFDPRTLACPAGRDEADCLTDAQLAALQRIRKGISDPDGRVLLPGFDLDSISDATNRELLWNSWSHWVSGLEPAKAQQRAFALNYFRYMVHSDPDWSLSKFDPAGDLAASERLAGVLSATDPDLSRFSGRGGKLILWHGWSDGAIPARASIAYYDSVIGKMGEAKAQKFLRLFMAPGMMHCMGGTGPNVFDGRTTPAVDDPGDSLLAALQAWVEGGAAPERVVATKYSNDLARLLAPQRATVVRRRPLCAYPKVARWTGKGSTDDAENFTCEVVGE